MRGKDRRRISTGVQRKYPKKNNKINKKVTDSLKNEFSDKKNKKKSTGSNGVWENQNLGLSAWKTTL